MENQRVRLTKQLLKNALTELLKEKRLDKITIYELCNKAQINRTTFYKYYGNQYELMDEIQEEFYQSLEESMMINDPEQAESLTDILRYVDANRELVKTLLNTISDENFIHSIISRPIISMGLRKCIPQKYDDWSKDYITTFIFHGAYAIVRDWINEGNIRTPEEVSSLVIDLILKCVKE